MSDDIVTQLRDWSLLLYPIKLGAFLEHAADDIVDYRKEIKQHFDMITKQRYEIERLEAEVAYLKTLCPRCDYEDPQ